MTADAETVAVMGPAHGAAQHATRAGLGPEAMLSFLGELAEHSGNVLFVRGVDGRYLFANTAFGELLGRSSEDIVGRTTHDLVPAEYADGYVEHDELILRDGQTRTVQETAVDGAGQVRHFTTHKFAVTAPDGRRFAVGGLCVDVTDVVVERHSRFESETRFRAVFDHAPIGQIYSLVGGPIESVNEPMARILGYRPDEIVGRPFADFARPAELDRIKTAAATLLSGQVRSTSAIRRLVHRDGHEVPVRVTSALLRDESGAPQWFVSMAADITDEERTQAELASAHAAAVSSSQRLRLMHAIAAAANEAGTADELAPRVLSLVREYTGWRWGALVAWSPDGSATIRYPHGALPPEALAAVTRLVPATDDQVTLHEVVAEQVDGVAVAVVPLLDGTPPARQAFVFVPPAPHLTEDHRTLLTLLGIEAARVVERESTARRLRDSEARFRAVFESSPLPMGLTLGDSGAYAAVNDALCALVGRPAEELVGHSVRDFVHPDDAARTDPAGAAALAAPDGRSTVELRLRHSDGHYVTVIISLAWMDGPDGVRQLLAQMHDVTASRTVEEIQRRQAEEDPLTGLANRSQLSRLLAAHGRAGRSCTALFLDLDGFKAINDTHGHDAGDEVLIEIARRLRAAVRVGDLVSRIGGDEFVVVCPIEADAVAATVAVADRIERALAEPVALDSATTAVTASIGLATGLVDPRHPQALVQRADAAMYQAKRLGKDRLEIYTPELHERTMTRRRTENVLRNAIAEDRFIVHYQPIVDLADERVVGVEALVRLVDDHNNLVPPATFIEVAEESGLVVPMGNWVLHESCRAVVALRERTGLPLTLSVNIAARQVARADFAQAVLRTLAETGLPEESLTLELTESALLEADVATLDQLVQLRDRGVVVGLDDFGTGYSSLSYLRSFPVSHLKVDRSFVAGLGRERGTADGASGSDDLAIVRSVIRLAEDLGLRWIAEGVETAEQRDVLRSLGRGLGQGYLWSRPVPADDLLDLLLPASVS
ncbi:PAS domain S-box-containing protein/diguanylate cyclase (GGDEF) domain-containing protein [Jatrophihabitans endophyticus]|uniref:PAS domain S-box-containing protein/diguanylate cyclase (GGDEF) domain-containing protein n=1 Tax=Jatrophihabitans endophyticus TaxID=1206085 RepID=A0A1M5DZI1_9ACTN|nr:GGDEF domain-containing phosphodiesterase [Jatrophihabitans endophyticus]SHF72212.1 PAS domain S-box-containing protein/diguanylate cyclase (GGDEF) domain-containing protein [Jatrophihabitans endophyticus]